MLESKANQRQDRSKHMELPTLKLWIFFTTSDLTGGFKYWFEIALYNYLYNEMTTRNVTLPDGTSFPQVDLPPYYAYYNPLLGVGKTKWTKPNPRNLTFTTLVFPILLEVVLSQNTVNILNVVSDIFLPILHF